MKTDEPVALLLRILDEAYEKKAWHGPNLKGTLRGVGVQQAVWRPAPDRHNVWELAVHAAYWKYAGWRRLTGEKRGAFAMKGSNWFVRPEPSPRASPGGRGRETSTEEAWRADLALLDEQHRRFRSAVEKIPARRLSALSPGSRHRIDTLVYGIAAHDVYHAGQIQLVKRLYRDRVGKAGRG
ncbi:MAG TPA: DinB family protein [Thermoanaerobaculia bacterium]|nr:DinB family protein [Thermoanaerobaculia bacterium]